MNTAGVTWGWFAGGFKPTRVTPAASRSALPRTPTRPGRSSRTTSRTTRRSSTTRRRPTRTICRRPRWPMIGHDRPGQAPVRPERLRRRAGGRQPAAGLVPEGGQRRGRAPGLLRPARRAALRRAHAQRAPAVAGVGVDRGLPGLRRLRRLVRPRPVADPQPARDSPSDALNGPGVCGPAPGRRRRTSGRCGPGPRLPLRADLPLRTPELRRPHGDRADLDHALHRGQLGPRRGSATSRSTRAPPRSSGMFDFAPGAPAAPKLILDPASGLAPGRGRADSRRRPPCRPRSRTADPDAEAADRSRSSRSSSAARPPAAASGSRSPAPRAGRTPAARPRCASGSSRARRCWRPRRVNLSQQEGQGRPAAEQVAQEGPLHAADHDHRRPAACWR